MYDVIGSALDQKKGSANSTCTGRVKYSVGGGAGGEWTVERYRATCRGRARDALSLVRPVRVVRVDCRVSSREKNATATNQGSSRRAAQRPPARRPWDRPDILYTDYLADRTHATQSSRVDTEVMCTWRLGCTCTRTAPAAAAPRPISHREHSQCWTSDTFLPLVPLSWFGCPRSGR